MSTVVASGRQAELAAESQATIESNSVRRAGYLETVRTLFSSVSGTGRTETACELGRVISESLCEEKSTTAKKKWMSELAKQICGSYCDDRKLINFVKLHHVSLRIPTLRQVGLTWAIHCVAAMKTGFDWKAVTDDMSATQLERAQAILPLLHDGIDNLGCDKKGNPQRKLWAKIISHYMETGSLPVDTADTATETASDDSASVPESTVADTVSGIVSWINQATETQLSALADGLSEEAMGKVYDALHARAERLTQA